jgi:histidinol dehydrogenase
MTAGLAKLAGVERVVVCTPPDSGGRVNDAILAAAHLCGVDEVYRCGGAQAIAALAYGTKKIPKVAKIVGPGGAYVALAKKQVSKDVAIDFYAGPTEIAVAVDGSSDAKLAAWDLIAQAEHGGDTLTCLVSLSRRIASEVQTEIGRILPSVERRNLVEKSLTKGVTAICDDRRTACNFISELAPEHLELLTRNPEELAERITSAGLILLGSYAPAAASDYCIGTDHVLPTGGFAANHSGLSVLDFVKLTWKVEATRKGLQRLVEPLGTLSKAEGLPSHYLSVKSRFQR